MIDRPTEDQSKLALLMLDLDAYLDILDRRKHQAFTEEDLENQTGMRRRWLEDRLFSDPFTMHLVPYKVWPFADAPPTLNF